MNLEYLKGDARDLPQILEEGRAWGVPAHPELSGRHDDAKRARGNLKAALSQSQTRLLHLKETIDSALTKTVEALASEDTERLTDGLIDGIAISMSRQGAEERLAEELQKAVGCAEEAEVRAAAALANAVRSATQQRRQELKQGYDNFRSGRGGRPTMGMPTGSLLGVRCQACQRVTATLHVESPEQRLSATMFWSRNGDRQLFQAQTGWRDWQCPDCRGWLLKDPEFVLLEQWAFVHFPGEEGIPVVQDGLQAEGDVTRASTLDSDDEPKEVSTACPETKGVEDSGFFSRDRRDQAILALRQAGKSEREISRELNLAKSTVHDSIRRNQ